MTDQHPAITALEYERATEIVAIIGDADEHLHVVRGYLDGEPISLLVSTEAETEDGEADACLLAILPSTALLPRLSTPAGAFAHDDDPIVIDPTLN